jgi:arginase family enzyme
MNWADYLIPASINTAKRDGFGEAIIINDGEPTFDLPASTKVAIIGIPEDRFSDGAGEIKSPEMIRKQLYSLSAGHYGTVVDMGNIRTGRTLTDTYYCIRDLVSELYTYNIVTLLIGGTMDLFYGNCLAMERQKITIANVAPQLRLPERGTGKHPMNTLMFGQPNLPIHVCNIGYQSYYVAQQELDYFSDRHFEAYRLGEVRDGKMNGCEPVVRDSDLLAISMDAVKYSDAPAASNASPNGFSGEETCQLAFFAGLSHKCRSLGIFDIIPQNDLRNITAKLAAQIAWYFIEGVKKRNTDNPKDNVQNFKKYLIFFDQLHHDLCFYKHIHTERWWMEVPSLNNTDNSLIISCTPEDFARTAEQEIPDRWWKTYQSIN